MISFFNNIINHILSDILFKTLTEVINEWQSVCVDCYKVGT